MKKIRIIFYRAKLGDKHALDDVISLWTGIFNWGTGPYSHVELWVPDKHGEFGGVKPVGKIDLEAAHQTLFKGTCYTSTMRGDSKGVVKRPASEILKNAKRWDYCEIEVSEEMDYADMIDTAETAVRIGFGYDFKAVMSFFWPWRVHDGNKYICSEFVYLLLNDLGVFKGFGKCPSPRRLSRWLTNKGYKIRSLT